MKSLPTLTLISLAAGLFVAGFWFGRSGNENSAPNDMTPPKNEARAPVPVVPKTSVREDESADTLQEIQLLRTQLAEEIQLRHQLEEALKQADVGKRAYEWFRQEMEARQFQGVSIRPISRDDLQLTDTLLTVSGINAEAYEQLESDRKQLLSEVRDWEQENAIITEMDNGGVSIEIPPMPNDLPDAFLAKTRNYLEKDQADFLANLYGRPLGELTQTRFVEVEYLQESGIDVISVTIQGAPGSGFLSTSTRSQAIPGSRPVFVKRWDHLIELKDQ
ncbi:hypothetical protein [Cerasicoccus fimbriatus]|uniref:hypothetical protein n=1 Tax=Cerasicoccus fimbriatus TaxID=3014554 RepID=UPI0022B5BC29|nr:hypothetical protein [Cerasicoccus sp. TK19100]